MSNKNTKKINICEICGISELQITVTNCPVLKYKVCPDCCIRAGGGYSSKCKNCKFTQFPTIIQASMLNRYQQYPAR